MAAIELPELADARVSEIAVRLLENGDLTSTDGILEPVLEQILAEIRPSLEPPFEARAARRGRLEWTLAARRLRTTEIDLPDLDAVELVVALAPDGQRTTLVDGEDPRAARRGARRRAGRARAPRPRAVFDLRRAGGTPSGRSLGADGRPLVTATL